MRGSFGPRGRRAVLAFLSKKLSAAQLNTRSMASKLSVLVVSQPVREWFRCRIVRPLLDQLRGGVTARRLAWSLALGLVLGINPTVGLTTLVVILLAWIFGLNQVASQVGCHAVAVTPAAVSALYRIGRISIPHPPTAAQQEAVRAS